VPRTRRRRAQRVPARVRHDPVATAPSPFTQFKQEYTRYTSSRPDRHGADAIFGLERPLMQLVDFFKSAAQGYGTEKRILLLHGPVGSSKSRSPGC
jgi:serine protein kinase